MQIDMGDISNEDNWIVGNYTNVTYYIIGLSAIIMGFVAMNIMGLSKIVSDLGELWKNCWILFKSQLWLQQLGLSMDGMGIHHQMHG